MEFIDEYEHIYNDIKVIYIPENIPTKETKRTVEDIAVGCQCLSLCRVETGCTCLNNFINYDFDLLTTDDNIDSVQNNYTLLKRDMPIYECNQHCLCVKYCGNRLVQFGPRKNLKIVASPEDTTKKRKVKKTKGASLVTAAEIKAGNFVCEYAGEILSSTEARDRFMRQERKNLMNYIFSLNENFGDSRIKTYIDPSVFGNIGRYINHSCDPNCEVIPVRVNSIVPKLCVFAKWNIEVDEEITFDYGDGELGFSPTEEGVHKKKKCLCNLANCRKYLPFCKEA